MPYYLGRGSPQDKMRLEIQEDQFERIKRHRFNLLRALDIEERFDILLVNYAEYESEILSISARHSIFVFKDNLDWHDELILLNRRLSNLLSSCRLYLDQSQHSLKDIFGNGSEVKQVKTFICNEYDRSRSYRLMEALRDYFQHRGLANSYAVHYRRAEASGEAFRACTVMLQLKTQELISDPKVQTKVKQDIEKLPEEVVDLTPHIRLYIEALHRVHCFVRRLLAPQYKEWESTIHRAIDEYKPHAKITQEDVPWGLAIFRSQTDQPLEVIERYGLVRYIIELRTRLEQKNVVKPDLARGFASGQIRESMD